ncbi:MAG TPA: adenylate/guanylate cyclase domain-containing protein, partial [Thermodesulfobacteriota bacterium]|nr:adenylate/guanylate cyclase domain-containing protein [Thermodesulfobacteriota bacterium]
MLGIFFLDPRFLSLLEMKSLDLRFLSRGAVPTSGEIVLVAVDQKSIDELGRWPWPRFKMAELLDALVEADAGVVGFDVVWSEPDDSGGFKSLSALKEKLEDGKIVNREISAYLLDALRKADADRALAEAMARSGRVVLGYFFDFSARERSGRAAGERTPGSYFNVVKFTSEDAAKVPLFEAAEAEVNIPALARSARGEGYFNIFPDADGTVRWVPLVVRYRDRYYPALSLAVLQKYLGDPPLALRVADFGVDQVRLGEVSIPVNEEGRYLINYRGPQKTFPHYSASDVIRKRIPAAAFRNKIVLVGATAIGIYDMRVTPFGHVFPGLEIHANVIDSILQKQFLHRPNWMTLADALSIVLVGVVMGVLLPRFSALWGGVVGVSLFAAVLLAGNFLFQARGIWMNLTYPALTVVLTFVGITGYRHVAEEREKKQIRGAFQYYLTPSVIEEMLRNPDKLKLGGEKKDLTVLFSDIRRFTSISERMTPEAMVKLLNEYLSRMTDVIFRYDGLLDKYIGDAIMAFWGAPMDQPDHVEKACDAALGMIAELHRLHKKWTREGLPALNIGVGINTGPMVVGNMGSKRRFNYTVMGDSVNTGSRLEGLNKIYGTNIIVSEMVYERVRADFCARELDLVRVKGKDQPVKIYE